MPDLTLEKALDVVRSAEATEMQMKELDSDSSVHGIGKVGNKSTDKKTSSDNEPLNSRYEEITVMRDTSHTKYILANPRAGLV